MDEAGMREVAGRILSGSIEYPTVLGESYEDIVDFYRELLSEHGVHVTVHRVPDELVRKTLPREFNPEKPRFILLARIGSGDRIIQFNGHYDVVAPGEGWETPPFKPVIRGDLVYGRGATDMKGGIAAVLTAMISLAEGREPGVVVEAALVPDEEIGGRTGTGYLVSELGSKPDYVVIAEPSGLDNIYIGHRGNVWGIVKTYGRQAHGSAPWLGDNAFEKMIVFAQVFLKKYRELISLRKSSYMYEDERAAQPTITPGGALYAPGSINIVPGEAGFSIDRRLIVEEKVEDVAREIKDMVEKVAAELGVQASFTLVESSPPAFTPPSHEYTVLLSKVVEKTTGVEPRKTICVGGLDLRYYTLKGIPAVSYGPGEVGLAHKPNEYIRLSDVVKAAAIYAEYVREFEKTGAPRS
ncbi:M20 family metallopeptidase [Desulfurococcus mucosus]|uniref:Acetylornithine deacetylase or succinyl-diaminopimelate desuccinylase n=1 Tax=Desulfurococcus mucosus (strain ATCC 35584 / DSM 2162 / JCM 9187 / O7/1) TaxID=765177 RepID=E8R8J3_DESM0|nr:M20 family metallopeptidase [Desulfurococcus mucosus]ADV64819.1 acetylornithine deacetylase or succinyl-diaminopimelate desuccinylase [Desulfurococcus mucosus DSM 2162]